MMAQATAKHYLVCSLCSVVWSSVLALPLPDPNQGPTQDLTQDARVQATVRDFLAKNRIDLDLGKTAVTNGQEASSQPHELSKVALQIQHQLSGNEQVEQMAQQLLSSLSTEQQSQLISASHNFAQQYLSPNPAIIEPPQAAPQSVPAPPQQPASQAPPAQKFPANMASFLMNLSLADVSASGAGHADTDEVLSLAQEQSAFIRSQQETMRQLRSELSEMKRAQQPAAQAPPTAPPQDALGRMRSELSEMKKEQQPPHAAPLAATQEQHKQDNGVPKATEAVAHAETSASPFSAAAAASPSSDGGLLSGVNAMLGGVDAVFKDVVSQMPESKVYPNGAIDLINNGVAFPPGLSASSVTEMIKAPPALWNDELGPSDEDGQTLLLSGDRANGRSGGDQGTHQTHDWLASGGAQGHGMSMIGLVPQETPDFGDRMAHGMWKPSMSPRSPPKDNGSGASSLLGML